MIDELRWSPLFVMDLIVGRAAAQAIGPTTAGWRGVFPVDGGRFEGARLRGTVNPGGADWVTMRSDAVMLIDVRLTLTADDGAIIGMTYTGMARATDDSGDAQFMSRETLPYEDMYLHTTPRFETGDPRYAWLNRIVAMTNGRRTEAGGTYHVFEIN